MTDGEGASGGRECETAIHQDDMILTEEEMIITSETGDNHQATASTEGTPTSFRDAMSNSDTMYAHPFWLRKGDWKRLNACRIQKETVRILFDPSFSSIELVS